MKKCLIIAAAALWLVGSPASAQDTKPFSHLSIGVGVGTTGIDLQVATPINDYIGVRAGYSFIPKIKPSFDVDIDSDEDFLRKEDGSGYYDKAEIEANLNMGDFKLLADIYPTKKTQFHFTAGFFVGKSKLASATTTNHFLNKTYWGNSGPELGTALNTYTVVSDAEGHVNLDLKVNSFKPYIGIGFGRPVPSKRLNVSFDFGVQFWGKPALWTNIDDNDGTEFRKVERDRILNTQDYCDDIRDGLEIMEKVVVYPVLTVRLNGRIF